MGLRIAGFANKILAIGAKSLLRLLFYGHDYHPKSYLRILPKIHRVAKQPFFKGAIHES